MKLRHRLLRLRLLMSKVASERYIELQEQRQLIDISLKAQAHRERESEVLSFVREKAEAHVKRKTKVIVNSGDAKRIGDKVILTRVPTTVDVPCAPHHAIMSGAIRVEEADVSADQFRNMLDKRHAVIKEKKRREYRDTRPTLSSDTPPVIENTKIAPADALHFMTTGKIPVRTRAELVEIVEVGIEKVEVSGDDAAAMLYLSKRNHRA